MKQVLRGNVDGKLRVAAHGFMWYIYMPYVHNPESAWKNLQTRLKKRKRSSRKPAIDTLDSYDADLKAKGRKPGSTRDMSG